MAQNGADLNMLLHGTGGEDTPAAPQTEVIMYFFSSCGMVG